MKDHKIQGSDLNLEREMRSIFNEYREKQFKVIQESFDNLGDEIVKTMTNSTSAGNNTGQFKRSWKKKKYKNAVYVYNERGAKGIEKGIPISNVAEYSAKGPQPFIKRTFNFNAVRFFNIFLKDFTQKIK